MSPTCAVRPEITLVGPASFLVAPATFALPSGVDLRHSISAVVPFIVAAVAREAGQDPAYLLEGSGVDPGTPPRADDHIDVGRYYEVWRRVIARQEPSFPLRVVQTFKLEDHEVFGFLAISCETLGQAYEKTASVRALYCVGARWEMQLDDDAMRLIWYPWPGDAADAGYRAAMEFAVADMANAIRRLGVAAPSPTAVRLAHPAPPDGAAFTAHYGMTPSWGAPLYELAYPRDLPAMRIASFNSRLRDYFDDVCRQLVDRIAGAPTVTSQLRAQLIGAMDGGKTSMDDVAKRLGMSARSLTRRLADEGTRFNDVLADVRVEFAKRYLARGTISASEVAYLIGFTEPPAFFKAFKRWTGMTPREFQQGSAA